MNKRLGIFLILGLLVLSLSFMSAGWFSDIFGKITGNTIYANDGIWLKANLHTHSTYSCPNRNDDGNKSPTIIMNEYKNQGYDVIALTPHFCVYPGTDCPSGVICIPAEEGSSYGNPVNRDILRINPSVSKSWNYKEGGVTNNEIKELCTSEENSLSIVAHPSSGHTNWTQNNLDLCYDNYKDVGYMEICNGGGITGWKGGYAEDLWAKQLKLGKKVFALGNDDAHQLSDVGVCWNKINVQEKKFDAVIDSLKEGNSYVSTGPSMDSNPFKIFCDGKNYLNMGQTGKCSNVSISGTINGVDGKKIVSVFLYVGNKKGTEFKIPLCSSPSYSCSFSYNSTITYNRYYRIVAEQEDTLVQFYSEGTRNKTLWSNPIWINAPSFSLVPLYRLYHKGSTDHLYTTSETNKQYAISQGFEYQRIEAYIYSSQIEGTIPLYRLWIPGNHMYTASKDNKQYAISQGFEYQGAEGYIYSSQAERTVPLYRFYSSSKTNHVYTTAWGDKSYLESSGFIYQGIVGYVYLSVPICTLFIYSPWSDCINEQQTRTIVSQSPSACTGGTPENLIQQCSPPCLLSNWQSTDSTCLSSNTLTRTWTKIGNCNQTIGVSKPNSETISCVYVPNIVTCTNFTYSNWSECFANGIQNRSLLTSTPVNCQAGNPILTQTCNYTAVIINQEVETNPYLEENNPNPDDSNNPNQLTDEEDLYEEVKESIDDENIIHSTKYEEKSVSLDSFFRNIFCRFFNLFREDRDC